jgi:probable rRNA maturation factor
MILNRQRAVYVDRRALQLFLGRVRQELGLNGAEVTICLVSDAKIADMNEAYRNKTGPTDVLSFPALARHKPLPLPNRNGHMPPQRHNASAVAAADRGGRFSPEADFLGDIAISPATARRNAKKLNRTLRSELQILILHGILHLLGYDHETDRGQMTRIENNLRRRLGLS